MDSTVCRAHQHAAGARDGASQKEPPAGVREKPDDHALGRSRGGFGAKIHLVCEQGQKPLALLVTVGQQGDSPLFAARHPGQDGSSVSAVRCVCTPAVAPYAGRARMRWGVGAGPQSLRAPGSPVGGQSW